MLYYELQNGETVCVDCYEGFGLWMEVDCDPGYYVDHKFEHDECIEPCEYCHLFQAESL